MKPVTFIIIGATSLFFSFISILVGIVLYVKPGFEEYYLAFVLAGIFILFGFGNVVMGIAASDRERG